MGGSRVVLTWLATRAFVLWLLLGPHAWVTGDVAYFDQSLRGAADLGLDATMTEYPLPAVVVVALPWLFAEWLGTPGIYPAVVAGLALATDAACTALLYWFGGRRGGPGLWVWVVGVPLLGATTYARFDLVPGALAGGAVLLLARHPRLAGVGAAVATGVKLWPALLLPALAGPRRTRRPFALAASAVGAVMVVTTLAMAGWDRLLSPLAWQSDRGLQVESVLATPVMLAWSLDPATHVVEYSDYHAFEISGPGVGGLLAVSTVLTLLTVGGTALLWLRAWRGGDTVPHWAVVWTCLATVTAFVVSSKVLSPQYLLWLLPVAAAGLVVVDDPGRRRPLLRWSVGLLVAVGATHLVFPVFYGSVTGHTSSSTWVVAILAVRNALLVLLLVAAAGQAWRGTSRRVRPSALTALRGAGADSGGGLPASGRRPSEGEPPEQRPGQMPQGGHHQA